MIHLMTCQAEQAVQIGTEVEVTVIAVEGQEVRLGIIAPGRRLTRIDPIPLPADASDMHLRGLERVLDWSRAPARRKE